LESYGRGATFICRNVFEIPYGFKLILKMVRRTTGGSGRFSAIFYKPLVGMIQMIRRWKDIDETQLFHVERSL
jgi:hypothetical protein